MPPVVHNPDHRGARLAERLREATRDEHARAERSGVMGRLLRGQLNRRGYCLLLRNLHPIYVALEASLATHRASPLLGAFTQPVLHRSERLEADLNAWYGSHWRTQLSPTVAAIAYARHLSELARSRPLRLVSHAYVRYFGDLNGGQLLRKFVARVEGPANAGLAFYDFGEDVQGLLAHLRSVLSEFVATEEESDALVDEAKRAFERHIALFEELDADVLLTREPTSSGD
ncbi:MAG: biliverdin-producing heme oxygenase [Burkholderiaceae bacterium]|jgi:heme oxygenase